MKAEEMRCSASFPSHWDATMLNGFSRCEYFWYLRFIRGFVPKDESVHLKFGRIFHWAVEEWTKRKFKDGIPGETALEGIVACIWTRQSLETHPDLLGWDSQKNPISILRTVIWFLDDEEGRFQRGEEEIQLDETGNPLVEVAVSRELGTVDFGGEKVSITYHGHFDKIVGKKDRRNWIRDYKTTTGTMDLKFFERQTGSNQFPGYVWLGEKAAGALPAPRGVEIFAAKILQTRSEFGSFMLKFSKSEIREWEEDTLAMIQQAADCITRGIFPMRRTQCFAGFMKCDFFDICRMSPELREKFLQSNFNINIWDPREKASKSPESS